MGYMNMLEKAGFRNLDMAGGRRHVMNCSNPRLHRRGRPHTGFGLQVMSGTIRKRTNAPHHVWQNGVDDLFDKAHN